MPSLPSVMRPKPRTAPQLHHRHLPLLLVSTRGRSGGRLSPPGTGLGHGCGSQGTTFAGTSPSTQGMTAAEEVTGRTWVSCTQLLRGASWAVLATMGGTGSPDLSCLVSEAPPGAQGCSHVVQHLRLHLVFTPVGRLEVLLLLLLVLPRLVCQLLFATVSLGWAGEESRPLGADGLPDHE